MALTKYERGNSWKTSVTYTSSNTNIDCSGNIANLIVYAPDGTTYMTGITGQHTSTGIYEYWVSTQSTDDLGIYVAEWKAWFDYSTPWNYNPKIDRYPVQIVYVD